MDVVNNQIKALPLEPTARQNALPNNADRVAELNQVEKKSEPEPKQAENLHGAVKKINDYVQNIQRDLQFTVDESTGKEVVTVVDSVSDEVIRQIPSEEALALARRLAENKDENVQLISTQV